MEATEATELLRMLSSVIDGDVTMSKEAASTSEAEGAMQLATALDALADMTKSAEVGSGATSLPVSVVGHMDESGAHVNMGHTVNKRSAPVVGKLLSPKDAATAMHTDVSDPPPGMPVAPSKMGPPAAIKTAGQSEVAQLPNEAVNPYSPKGGVVPATAQQVAAFTKRDAKAPEKRQMAPLLKEPMQSSKTDSTLQEMLTHAEGAKVASDPVEEARAIIASITENM